VTDKNGNISESRCNISVGEGLLGGQGENKIVFPSEFKSKTSFPAIDLENIDQSAQDIVKKVGELLSDEQKEKYILDPIQLAELLRDQQDNIESSDDNKFKVVGEEVLSNVDFQQKIENFNFIEVFEKGFKNVLCSVKQNLINERKNGSQYKKNICIGDIRNPEYSCNELTGRCVVVPYATGKYSSLSLCESNCFKKENITRYSCNVLSRQCEQS